MISETQARELVGATAYDESGTKIGRIGQLFLDDQSGQPEFVTVNTGLFGSNESFVPVADARVEGETVTVPFTKDTVKDAPNVDVENGHLDESEETRLYAYYGMGGPSGTDRTDGTDGTVGPYSDVPAAATDEIGTAGHDTSGPNTDDAMTRSEERVEVGTASQEAGRVRLRKYVTTETETHTVPVRKEHAVVEREPITGDNVDAATDGPDISEEEHEVVLSEERPVVDKTVEPIERVRLGTESTTEEAQVSEEVRKERVETEGDVDRPL
jgi:uncharacterized protein (TIGR02271 family)